MTVASIGPHAFAPLRFWDRFFRRGRCRYCLHPHELHPVWGYSKARPW